MSTQNKTTSSSQFDPGSMGVFGGLTNSFGSGIQSEINNPYGNMAFLTQMQMQNKSLGQQGGAQNQAMLQRMQAMGINQSSPFFAAQLGKLQRQQSANQAGGYNNLLLQASQLRQQALGQAGSYRPLQTGQTQTQQQSGLGTWLPQLIGAGLGIAGGAMGGGAGLAMGSMFKGGSSSALNNSIAGNNAFIGGMNTGMDLPQWQGQGGVGGQTFNPFLPGGGA